MLHAHTQTRVHHAKEKKKRRSSVYVCDLLVVSVRELEYEMKTTRQVTSL